MAARAETLQGNETTHRADSFKKKERNRFWNKVIGWGVGLVAGSIIIGALLTPFLPTALALAHPLVVGVIEKTLSVAMGSGIVTGLAGATGRAASEFRK